jgi:hypothetical protein
VRAEIGLGFEDRKGDGPAAEPANEPLSKQLASDDIGAAVKKSRLEEGILHLHCPRAPAAEVYSNFLGHA